ncbi:hypothetical protein JMM63_06705 [Rhodovulum sulfidophilum]|uniref:Uncharacterized protein n=1 Tax=Rhodovulum sulfidophilum TaxID=35806 RepID=A0A0D6AZK7_RHOSU|nr:hypothetical protein [Rhodovulum sulfidophilum]MBL3552924.1 hypothetical protein [Rhodovulum sulfidophilum]MBL3562157.1 hypothetical protein [Rhodovulum sulfidophilum]MBL3567003.1 hypothetical protein [Rhodovulum sulfidophilum]MBL3574079.1 hypothetical protein [Rhodovulum sulfidophilum]MBL3584846.1 hypothetical protein [Rhodovulum sulfidophilum]
MSADTTFDAQNAIAVEGPHWAPPVAPMDMPQQVLEARRELRLPVWLARLMRPLQLG